MNPFVRWARDVAPINHSLTTVQSDVLLRLAVYTEAESGSCFVRISRLAEGKRSSVRTIQRALRELENLGLITTVQRTGRSSFFQLFRATPPESEQVEVAAEQMTLDEQLTLDVATPDTSVARDTHVTQTPDMGVTQKNSTEEEQPLPHRERANARAAKALPEHFERVMEILAQAPEMTVCDAAVDTALRAHPETAGYDHIRAALEVVQRAQEGDRRTPHASRALGWRLDDQLARRSARTGAPSHEQPPRHRRRPTTRTAQDLRPWQQPEPVDAAAVYARAAAAVAHMPDDDRPF